MDRLSRFDASNDSTSRFEKLSKERELRRKAYEASPHSLPLRGLCMEMCPEYERYEREVHLDLSSYEMVPGTEKPTQPGDHPRIDHGRAVKKYHRPAAGNEAPLPEDVRPAPILYKTMSYLIGLMDQIWATEGLEGFAQVQKFVRDRTRSIRQDATLQNLRVDPESIAVHEEIARFHILSGHRLCELPVSDFDAFQNTEQMRKVLQSLSEFYLDSSSSSGTGLANEPEFRAYYLLTHLEDPDVFRKCFAWPKEVLKSTPVQFALSAGAALHQSDYVHFFTLIKSCPPGLSPTVFYLSCCLLQAHFGLVRKGAARIICKAYAPGTILPTAKLAEWLAFQDETELVDWCEAYGFRLLNDACSSVVKPAAFPEVSSVPRPRCNHRFIEAILGPTTSLSQIISISPPVVRVPQNIAPLVQKQSLVQPLSKLPTPILAQPPTPMLVQAPTQILAQPPIQSLAQPTVPVPVIAPIPPIILPANKPDLRPMAKAMLDDLVTLVTKEQLTIISTSVHKLRLEKTRQSTAASSLLLRAFLDENLAELSKEAALTVGKFCKQQVKALEEQVWLSLLEVSISELVRDFALEAHQTAFIDRLRAQQQQQHQEEQDLDPLLAGYEARCRIDPVIPSAKRRLLVLPKVAPVGQPTMAQKPVHVLEQQRRLAAMLEEERLESARFEAKLQSLMRR